MASGTLETVHGIVERLARSGPTRVAVAGGGEALTYAELNARANGLAYALLARGAKAESPVGVCLERSPELLAALLAVFKTGAPALLLDPAWPERRIEEAIAAAGATIVIAADPSAPDADRDPGVSVHPDNLAYLVQTSGSTGSPKLVGVTHRALAHRSETHRIGYGLSPDDRATWLTPSGASLSAAELWPPLAAGASIHVPEPAVVASAVELRDWMLRERITTSFVPTPLAEQLLALEWPRDASLRLVTLGGDAVRRWPREDLPFEAAVEYGSAEANGVTSCLVPREDRLTSANAGPLTRLSRPPIGRPWPDVRVAAVDSKLRRAASETLAELCVAGPELARGYVGAPAATAASFVPDPFGKPGGRMYRTGDVVRVGADGRLTFHGRVDAQIKILGLRVEPAEVEAALLEHTAVSAAAVAAVEGPDGAKRLAAYVVASAPVGVEPLRAAVAACLPEHMVPTVWTFLDELPLNASLKVDRLRLPKPELPRVAADMAQPRASAVGQELAALWSEALAGEDPADTTNFFKSGGDSLSAGKLVARIRERWHVQLRLGDFAREPTFGALLERVEALHEAAPASAVPDHAA